MMISHDLKYSISMYIYIHKYVQMSKFWNMTLLLWSQNKKSIFAPENASLCQARADRKMQMGKVRWKSTTSYFYNEEQQILLLLRVLGFLVSQILEHGRTSISRKWSRVLNIAQSGKYLDDTGLGNVLWGFHI